MALVGATEDIPLFQLDLLSFQSLIGFVQAEILRLMAGETRKNNSGRQECSVIPQH